LSEGVSGDRACGSMIRVHQVDLLSFISIAECSIFNALIILKVMWFGGPLGRRYVGHALISLKQDEELLDSLYC